MSKWFMRLNLIAIPLALTVVILGAYTRLSDAGLGCPDWPGCYGHVGVPQTAEEIKKAHSKYERPVEAHKAWKEMIHRYFASTLGLVIMIMAILAFRNRHNARQPTKLPYFLFLLVVLQGMLGMWTVTLKVHPVIVMLHLIGGFTTLSLLWWLFVRTRVRASSSVSVGLKGMIAVGIVILVMQIALGGWTSSNYAAMACTDLPGCHVGQPWPKMNFHDAFLRWQEIGHDYEYGKLDSPARVAIHMTHRIGAVVTFLFLALVALLAIRRGGGSPVRSTGVVLMLVLLAQVALGLANVFFKLPLGVAVTHNAVAAVLLLVLLLLNHHVRPQKLFS